MIYRSLLLLILTISVSVVAIGQTTEFTYQGQLQSSSMPASGSFDFEFALYDSVAGGAQIGSTLARSGVGVSNGIFSVNLDFGSSFPGAGRFLEIRVRQAGGGAFTELTPTQPVSSAPYSVKSLNAESATSATNFTGNLTGDVTGTQAATTVNRLQGRNVASTLPLNGQVLKYNSANNQWEPDSDNTGSGGGGGTITGVTPGTGLTGGGATGNVTLAIGNGGVGTAQLADGAVTDAKIATVSGAKVTGAVTNSNQLGGIAANQYVQTTDSRMTDARNPLPGSTNYIQNQNAGPQSLSNFSISGNGTAGGTLSGNVLNATTQLNLGGTRILTATNEFFGSMYFGFGAGTNGLANTFFGYQAGQANSTSNNAGANSFFGRRAGTSNTDGGDNSFFGSDAGTANTTGSRNSFFGRSAGVSVTEGIHNSFFGRSAGLLTTTGEGNTFVGANTGISSTTGSNNTLLGHAANVASTVSFGTAIGSGAVVTQSNTLVLGRPADDVNVPGTMTVAGALTANGAGLNNLNASNITTGTLAATRGGTGLAASGAAGNFLRSNGAAWISSPLQAADIPTGSGNYIQNSAATQAGAGFNISGNGIVGGNLGVGQASPSAKLDVFYPGGNGGLRVRSQSSFAVIDVDAASGEGGYRFFNNGSYRWFIRNAPNIDRLEFQSNNNDDGAFIKMMILNTGEVGIGANPSARLHVGNGTDAEPTGGGYIVSGAIGGANVVIDDNEVMARSGGAISPLFINNDGGNVLLIAGGTGSVGIGTNSPDDKLDVNGDIRIGTSGINGCLRRNDGSALIGICSSDMRFKRNITPFASVLSKVSRLRPVHYYWRATDFPAKRFGDLQSYGLIAQEVEQVLPELVSTDAAGFKQIDYSKLPLVTIQAVKELKVENDTLKAENTAMQQMLIKMDARLKSVEKTVKANGRARR